MKTMEEYYCEAYPDIQVGVFSSVSEFGDQYFNVEVEYTGMFILNAVIPSETTRYKFLNIPKVEIMKENTIVRWLCHMGVPEDAYGLVVPKILTCAHDMANRTHKHHKVLHMRVSVDVPWLSEDAISEDIDDDDEHFEEEEEEEEDEDDFMEDEDHGLVPAAKSCIEGLEMVRVEQQGSMQGSRCAICFEDFNVGARMPCLHMFHKNCIVDWLQIGNSCPLCRFQMPTSEK